ncbi:unnamed protein product [Staurois parvus]|uniref:Uncharacterized protein n=1 Tax=Staurois parvus TaxID=386267 RepID=A0ABN9B3A0_9NEOB|nr:unnamed protein product [Staurois parvus]
MALGRKGLTSGVIKGLTVCCVCFTVGLCQCVSLQAHCFGRLWCAQPSKAVWPS